MSKIIAMWSGPRNLSTALMRSFGNRRDVAAVMDEPFYAAYLQATGKQHPMRDEVIASQPTNWQEVADGCRARMGEGLVYQKHMSPHMLEGWDWGWTFELCNCFLIRNPERVVASFIDRMPSAQFADLGFQQQAELFDRLSDSNGAAPPVLDSDAILANPDTTLRCLCRALAIDWDEGMLQWAPGPRDYDGVWASHWYSSVHKSTGFAETRYEKKELTDDARRLVDRARPFYEKLSGYSVTNAADSEPLV